MRHELLISAGLVLVLDIITKAYVCSRLAEGDSVRFGRWFRIRHLVNPGRNRRPLNSPIALVFIWVMSIGVLCLVLKQGYFFLRPVAQEGLGAAIGGAAGNLYDRIRRGGVIDFIDLGWWPVFNIADIGISVGAITALCSIR